MEKPKFIYLNNIKEKFKRKKEFKNKKIFVFFNFIIIFILITCIIKTLIFRFYNYSNYLYLFINAHKDFTNKLTNSYYLIICDNKTQLKNKYQLKIIETYKNNELYQKKRGYCEGSKIYYIWKKYKNGKMSSKYVGFIHYRRVFTFKDNIPDLDAIFSKYDAIINKKIRFNGTMKIQFANCHIGKFLDEIEIIIKENFTQYYQSAKKSLNNNLLSCCNIFIMKKKDFIKYGEFVFGVLFEFDRRHKINNDNDIKNLIISESKKSGKNPYFVEYQFRQEAFLMERISSIFYDYYFKKTFEIRIAKNN
jgi:hypothetical protein